MAEELYDNYIESEELAYGRDEPAGKAPLHCILMFMGQYPQHGYKNYIAGCNCKNDGKKLRSDSQQEGDER